MITDLQKANPWKRISAYLFDMILLVILIVGIAFLLSSILGYDTQSDKMEALSQKYATLYGVDLDISVEDYNALSPEEHARYDAATEAFAADAEANYLYSLLINLTLIITTFSILIACLILEFAVPLLFGNGQTLGKKIFGIGVMRADGVRVTSLLVFIRTVLGKFTVETMIPVLLAISVYFGVLDIVGVIVILGILVLQIALILSSRTRSAIHDMISGTVTVDIASQMIFETREEMLEYRKKLHAERAEKAAY